MRWIMASLMNASDDSTLRSRSLLRQLQLISLVPRPTAAAWPGVPRRTVNAGAAGVPSNRRDTGAAAEDTRRGFAAQ